jgi:hypothetical protein
MSQHTHTELPRPRYDSEAERAGNKLKDNEARIASLERRPSGGGDPGPWNEYASAALGGTWTNVDETDKFKWRRKRQITGSLDNIGLEFSGEIVGGTSGSTVITFGSSDRFSKDKQRIPVGVRVDGVAKMGHAKIIASTGVMTIDFPIGA